MGWTEKVRRSLTYPSGKLLPGVSATVYRKWVKATHLARPTRYADQGEMSMPHILRLARNNTRDEDLARQYP